ncbi:MAG: SAM-dependent methyltransferase [Proteobacteria bacterium]|jgi:16S rRNA (cytidine1402-2'-O)-methyltransferase|nr:SAM-dependent methyltransferase [Pseudomonadota bacterium]
MAKLFLIPTTLSNNIDHSVLLDTHLQQIRHIRHFIVETPKIARMHLKCLNLSTPLQELYIQELNKHEQDIDLLIKPLLDGIDVGLISDCGMPAIADPGSQIVREAHLHNIKVVPFYGPNSLLLALMASGVNGQSFTFNGYLPIDGNERKQKLMQLQELVLKYNISQIIIETPFRNQQLLQTLIEALHKDIRLCLAINLMQPDEHTLSKPISEWRKLSQLPNIHKQEVVFILGK